MEFKSFFPSFPLIQHEQNIRFLRKSEDTENPPWMLVFLQLSNTDYRTYSPSIAFSSFHFLMNQAILHIYLIPRWHYDLLNKQFMHKIRLIYNFFSSCFTHANAIFSKKNWSSIWTLVLNSREEEQKGIDWLVIVGSVDSENFVLHKNVEYHRLNCNECKHDERLDLKHLTNNMFCSTFLLSFFFSFPLWMLSTGCK